MNIPRNPAVNGVCDADFLELVDDPVTQQTVKNCLQIIVRNTITYKNASPPRNRAFIPQRHVKYVEDIIFTIYKGNLGMPRRGVIQKISDIGQASSYVQSNNCLHYRIW